MGILEDLNEVEIKITIKPDAETYCLEIDTIKVSTLRNVLMTIVESIDDGSLLESEGVNTYGDIPDNNDVS